MNFEININGIDVELNIRNYQLYNRDDFSDYIWFAILKLKNL